MPQLARRWLPGTAQCEQGQHLHFVCTTVLPPCGPLRRRVAPHPLLVASWSVRPSASQKWARSLCLSAWRSPHASAQAARRSRASDFGRSSRKVLYFRDSVKSHRWVALQLRPSLLVLRHKELSTPSQLTLACSRSRPHVTTDARAFKRPLHGYSCTSMPPLSTRGARSHALA